jgi:hypothetical protein
VYESIVSIESIPPQKKEEEIMNIRPPFILALAFASLVSNLHAVDAGRDSAAYYKADPEQYDGRSVSIDCAYVTRINNDAKVAGVAFFVAHTIDDKNEMRGGGIVVAVLDDAATSFERKYGYKPEIDRRGNSTKGRVETKRLLGTFHQLKGGRVYIDYSGEANVLIQAKAEEAQAAIGKGEAISRGNAPQRHGPVNKKF